MRHVRTIPWLLTLATAGAWPAALPAQDAPLLPAAPAVDPAEADEAAELQELINQLTPEQVDELLVRASAARLQVERDTAAAEIRGDLLYEPVRKDAALRILSDSPADTQADNIERILRAFATVDEEFAAAHAPFSAGDHAKAAAGVKESLDVRNATYRSAAAHFLYAESLFAQKRYDESVEAYRAILTLMPDRISFAAESAGRCAEAYEQLGRLYYAMEMYAYTLQNYGLTLSDERLDEIIARLNALQEMYEDPLGTVASHMGEVHRLLGAGDTGEETREKQQVIVRVLEDLIKTAEENQSRSQQQDSAQNQGQQQDQKKDSGQQGQNQGPTVAGGRAGGPPSSPAQRSTLPPGPVERPSDLQEVRETAGGDTWSQLPPEVRRRAEEEMERLLSEQYLGLIRDYRRRLSGGGEERR